MKKLCITTIFVALICTTLAAAHQAEPVTTLDLEQEDGDGYGTVEIFEENQLVSHFYQVQKYVWYTLIDFRDQCHVTCLGTRKSGYMCEEFGRVSIHAEPVSEPTNLMLVLSKDVSCYYLDGQPLSG